MALTLGPFRLETPIARGGMSEVWRGTHTGSGVRVAVKLLPRALDESAARKAFRGEVRAVARLDHPGIVQVLDFGVVDEEQSRLARNRVRSGSPWIAMEHASGGSLAQLGTLSDWNTLRAVLLSILDALAHAHARDLVHRDLKPGNVLLCTGTDDRPGLKLTDFGIVYAMDAVPERGLTAGTPQYMAPEQLRGMWRAIGPWTDLYGLGCLAWVLVTGRAPFDGNDAKVIRRGHLEEPPPPLEARFEVPDGFGLWLRCLLAKDPADRFKRAAEAAAALLAFTGEARGSAESIAHSPAAVAASLEELPGLGPDAVVAQPTTLAIDLLGPGLDGARATWRPTALVPGPGPVPEVPRSWRHPVPRPPSLRLRGAGIGLLGLREHRLVGRDAELDRCWAAVREAMTDGARTILVTGQPGVGRSRLAAAVAHRVHELALGEVFTAHVEARDRAVDALWRVVEHRLGLWDAIAIERERVAEELLGPGRDAELLARRMAGERGALAEEFGLLGRVLRAIAGHRPLVVILDDAHGDPDAIDWARAAMERPDLAEVGLLVIVTAREDLPPGSEEAGALRALAKSARVRPVSLGRLGPGTMGELLRQVLGLEGSAAARIIGAARGNPGFALAVVREWADRGLLVSGPHGFELSGHASVELPGDLSQALLARVREAVAELPPLAWGAVERAAVLGDPVDRELWHRAVGADPLVLRAIEEELVDARLVEPEPGGFSFATATLREALVGEAGRGDRLVDHHVACAEVLAGGDAESDARLALHRMAAGDPAGAIEPLLRAVEVPNDQYQGLDRVARLTEALELAQVPKTDPRWGRVWAARAGLSMRSGRYDEAESWAGKALAAAEKHGWAEVAASAAFEGAVIALHRHLGTGAAQADRALELAEAVGDRHAIARATYLRGASSMERRDWDLAEARLESAMIQFRDLGDLSGEADCYRDLGNVALFQGDLMRAEARYRGSLDLFRRAKAPLGEAHALNGLADVARKRGQLAEAEAGYRAALAAFERCGAGQAMLARLNLGLVLVDRSEWARAREVLEATRAWLEEQRRDNWVAAAGAVLLPVYLALGDREAFDRTVDEVEVKLVASRFAQPDIALVAERGAEIARMTGDVARANACDRIARLQRERLERW